MISIYIIKAAKLAAFIIFKKIQWIAKVNKHLLVVLFHY